MARKSSMLAQREVGDGLENWGAAIRCVERATMSSIACCPPLAACRTHFGVVRWCWLDFERHLACSMTERVVAVAAVLHVGAIEGRWASL